jgi:hypothetical protein
MALFCVLFMGQEHLLRLPKHLLLDQNPSTDFPYSIYVFALKVNISTGHNLVCSIRFKILLIYLDLRNGTF